MIESSPGKSPRWEIHRKCLWVVLFLLLTGCSGNTTHQVCAVVLATEGTVTAEGQRITSPQGADPGARLCPGTSIQTSVDSRARIACLSNTLIDLSENSTLGFERLTLTKDGNETDDDVEARGARCRIGNGKITIAYRGAEGVSEVIVLTPHGTMTAKFSCIVRLKVDDKKTRITCASGSVAFEPWDGHGSVVVEAGFVAELPANGAAIVPATATTEAQQEVTAALESERQLATLVLSRRATLPWKP
jgi:FecR protein